MKLKSSFLFIVFIRLKFLLLRLIFFFIINNIIFAQSSGQPYYPETANGAKNIHSTGHRLLWQNPDSTIFNIVFFSEDSNLVSQLDPSAILYNGTPSTIYDTVYLTPLEPLDWNKKYYWRVVEYFKSGSVAGPVLYFKTMPYPYCVEELLFDDFTGGTNNWIINNDGGTCIWQVHNAFEYTLPITSTGNVMAADADFCGSGTTTLSTMTLTTPIGSGFYGKVLEFDNDWNALDAEDKAYVEVSTDGGISWEVVWSKIGVDLRNSHENIFINYSGEILIRFKSVQPGWDWWWAIDNVRLEQNCPLTQFYPPHNLKLNIISQPLPIVELNWSRGQFADIFTIERKTGIPTDTTAYSIIGSVNPNVTSYIDTTIESDQIYTYKVFNMNAGKSNEATAYFNHIVPVELTSFTASVTDNDVILNWSTVTELNNSGFEVQRLSLNVQSPDWNKISFMLGQGTTTEQHHYSCTDKSIPSGKYQYRLKQIDYDGTFEYSNIVEIEVESPTEFSLEQNYPNPFNPTTKIKFSIPQNIKHERQNVLLKIYDVLGNDIATLINEEKPAGNYEVEFSGEGLTSGIYFYQLKVGSFIASKKLMLLK